MSEIKVINMNSRVVILAALVLSGIGALYYNMLPLYLGAAQDDKMLANNQIGFLSFSFFLGYNILTISAFFWIRKVDWRLLTLVSLPFCCIALYASSFLDSFEALIGSTVIAGAAFASLYGLGATILGDTDNPARWYGAKIALEAAIGAVLFLILPSTLMIDNGFDGLVLGMILTILVLSPLLLFVPSHGAKDEGYAGLDKSAQKTGLPKVTIWMTLLGTVLFFSAETTIWAFIERIGSVMEFEATAVGNLLSVTLVCALTGSFLAIYLGDRFGNVRPLVSSGVLFFCALLGLGQAQDFIFYAVSACAVMFSVGYGIPYAFSEIAELDTDGRYIVLTVPAIGVGAMIGPAIAGYLAEGKNFVPVLIFGGVCIALAIVLLASARRFMPKAASLEEG